MKLMYAGDLVLQHVTQDPVLIFGELKHHLIQENIDLIVNLESCFVPDKNLTPVKDKITLYATSDALNYINYLSPFLINLANNHINDFGNEAVKYTEKLLKGYHYWGVGYSNEKDNNVFVDAEHKVVHIAYITRSSDMTGGLLFAGNDFIGGFAPDVTQLGYYRKKYTDYSIIVNIHWGLEDIVFPETEKKIVAHQLIDAGADLIIGHHSHIVQGKEEYKGKTIFYSIGNFFFPYLEFRFRGQVYQKFPKPHQKTGILPIVEINDGKIQAIKVWKIDVVEGSIKIQKHFHLFTITKSVKLHQIIYNFYRGYLFCKRIMRFISCCIKDPGEGKRRLIRRLKF